jgi:hypothetical protein
MCLLTHSLTHLLTHSPTYLLTHSLTHSLTHLLTHSLTHLLTYLLTYAVRVTSFRPDWWARTIGFDTSATPEATLEDLMSTSAQHVFYSYPLRPNYPLRVHINQMVKQSPLTIPHKCAMLHIRRGDILFHINQVRLHADSLTHSLTHFYSLTHLLTHSGAHIYKI